MPLALAIAAGIGVPVLGYFLGIFTGAPYLPTGADRVERMLELAEVGPGTKLVDLGSGDGRIVRAAAKRGAEAVGYEINPILVLLSWQRARNEGVGARARFVRGDFRKADLSHFDVVAIYGVSSLMRSLEPRLEQELKPGARVVSNVFAFPHWQGRAEGGIHLYVKR